jgi:AraC-like DNA-binding protein
MAKQNYDSVMNRSPHLADLVVRADEPEIARLAGLISACAPHDGSFALRVPGTWAIRYSRKSVEVVHAVQRPALCIVAQGGKSVMLGREVYEYKPPRMLVYSVDLPIAAQITRASEVEPYLCFMLELDPRRVAELTMKVYPDGPLPVEEGRGVYVGQANVSILNAATRLMELMVQQKDADLLAPLVVDEILIRLLSSPVGGRVAQIGHAESNLYKVAKAIAWLQANFAAHMNVEQLAESVHMSVSSFHHHFKAATSMSPLQYQKALRLQQARRLMLSKTIDAGTTSRRVGYQSVSQFSREYARFFGSAPTRDIARLRKHGLTAADVSPSLDPLVAQGSDASRKSQSVVRKI